jgi:hypothetical protein
MPAGMELFPAADDTAWQLIKDVIDGSDYYVLIVGGRYGSLDETGLGYTEKEYDYAVSSKKPIIPLLHENPDNLPRGKTETEQVTWEKLKAFRSRIEKYHTCVYWKNAEDLKAKVIIGLTSAMKRRPAIGWIRADQVPSDATLAELLALRKRITELEANAEADRTKPPQGTEHLMQGTDTVEINCTFFAELNTDEHPNIYNTYGIKGLITPSWNEIFAAVAPSMILETSDNDLRKSFRPLFDKIAREEFKDYLNLRKGRSLTFHFRNEDFDTCIVQLRALGLIKESLRQRSVKDTETYWTLTPYGDYVMVQLRALSKESSEKADNASSSASSELTITEA